MRLVDADALKKYYIENLEFFPALVKNAIDRQPTIDPVKHGKWLNDSGYDDWYCSECGFEINYDGEYPTEYDNFRFCGCCGAEMGREKI